MWRRLFVAGVPTSVSDTYAYKQSRPIALRQYRNVLIAILAVFLIGGWLLGSGWSDGQGAGPQGGAHSTPAHAPAMWSIIPFLGLLLSIAFLPLIPTTAH